MNLKSNDIEVHKSIPSCLRWLDDHGFKRLDLGEESDIYAEWLNGDGVKISFNDFRNADKWSAMWVADRTFGVSACNADSPSKAIASLHDRIALVMEDANLKMREIMAIYEKTGSLDGGLR